MVTCFSQFTIHFFQQKNFIEVMHSDLLGYDGKEPPFYRMSGLPSIDDDSVPFLTDDESDGGAVPPIYENCYISLINGEAKIVTARPIVYPSLDEMRSLIMQRIFDNADSKEVYIDDDKLLEERDKIFEEFRKKLTATGHNYRLCSCNPLGFKFVEIDYIRYCEQH